MKGNANLTEMKSSSESEKRTVGGFASVTDLRIFSQEMRTMIWEDLKRKFDRYEVELLSCLCDQALAQISHGACGVFLTGDIQDPSGHNPVPCTLDDTWAGWLDQITHCGFFQPDPLCDSVILYYSEFLSYIIFVLSSHDSAGVLFHNTQNHYIIPKTHLALRKLNINYNFLSVH